MLCLNKDQNIFDSKKRIKAATVEGLEHKLTSKHQAAIARNNALLAMYTNQVDLCKTLSSTLREKGIVSEEEMIKINAGVLSRAGKIKDAVALLLDLYKLKKQVAVLSHLKIHVSHLKVKSFEIPSDCLIYII